MELATYPPQQTAISLQATQRETPEAWGSVTEKCWWKFFPVIQRNMQEKYGNAYVIFKLVGNTGWAFSDAPCEVVLMANKATLY